MSRVSIAFESRCCRWAVAILLGLTLSARAATFVVTSPADVGAGTLRAAISNANFSAGADVIQFNLPGGGPFTISPLTALPTIAETVVIDATTQPGFVNKPVVQLNGSAVTTGSGLLLNGAASGGSLIRGLTINRFGRYGVEMTVSSSNVVEGCFLGTDTNGTAALANGRGSVFLKTCFGNLIGGTNAGAGNVLSGSLNDGVYLEDNGGHRVIGNVIGLGWGGTNIVANLQQGVRIRFSSGNIIGGPTPAERNIISGNGASGVVIDGVSSSNNVVQGNYIGLNAAGTAALGNTNSGVRLTAGARFNTIGGTNAGEGNVISGNRQAGLDANVGAFGNIIQGNLIGTLPSGTSALGNLQYGVAFSLATNNLVGGTITAARNVIAGNGWDGVGLVGASARSNRIEGNFIGVNALGTSPLGNGKAGVWVSNAVFNTIGSAVAGGGNVISGNGVRGIYLFGTGCASNQVYGNLVGTDAAGSIGFGNGVGHYGIVIDRAPANLIGGPLATMRNVISSNNTGIYMEGTGASNNVIQGNYIGTDITGLLPLGNQKDGITLGTNQPGQILVSNVIGGAAPGEGNLICANGIYLNAFAGIYVGSTVGTVVRGNRIGAGADGLTPLGNVGHAVELQLATNCTIAGNIIANTIDGARSGIRLRSGLGNSILGNSIYGNGLFGISMAGTAAVANDACDGDGGANGLQNYPVLTNAISGDTTTLVKGFLESAPNQSYLLQFYANPVVDNSGYGEGRVYLGAANFAASGACSNNFDVTLPTSVPAGWFITATATDAAGNTSEFSRGLAAVAAPPLFIGPATNDVTTVSWTLNNATNSASGVWQLHATTNLAPPVVWSAVPEAPTVLSNGTHFRVTQPATNPAQFYRLQFQ
jgi:titin